MPAERLEPLTPATIDSSWMPLEQRWRGGVPDPDFQPGWARMRWDASALSYDVLFMGSGAQNNARQLNERTWELGDVGEIFLQADGRGAYLELHVTPENQRLQLLWSADGLTRVRSKAAVLAEFMIHEPGWVQSEASVRRRYWSFRVRIPAQRLGLTRFHAGQRLRTAVCRYHRRGSDPSLSSTAPLPLPFFHQREHWHRLILIEAPSSPPSSP